MHFSLVCLLAVVTTVPFGLAFVLAPEFISAQYGIAGWNAGTLVVARLFGVALLYTGGAAFAVRSTMDPRLQTTMSTWFALASAVATVVSVQAVTSATLNALGWSTVAIYALFTVAWTSVAFRRT